MALLCSGAWSSTVAAAPAEQPLPISSFRLVESASGPVNYYSLLSSEQPAFIRSKYAPPYETAVMGYAVSKQHQRATQLSWRWRALTLPRGGDECRADKADSAAVVYVSWKRGLRYYTLKYVWSAVGTRGAVCDKKRNPLLAQDTVIRQSGAPLNVWVTERVDLRAEFRKHFEDGNPAAEVPNLFGIAVMSDGDQTRSESSADFSEFRLK